MHYLIDGYNMLFRLMHARSDLQTKREQIIYDLNKKISILNWDVAVIFDATFQIGPGSRSHYNCLEILFTAEGETADEFIINELKACTNPRLETVVTSDKTLAWHARCRHAHTESIEEFVARLNKLYKNKLKKGKQEKIAITEPLNLPKLIRPKHKFDLSVEAKPNWSLQEYERIFEEEFQRLIQEERTQKEANEQSKQKKPRQPKRKKDLFLQHHQKNTEANQMENWLKIFEEKWRELNLD